jgi:hypothetical protein
MDRIESKIEETLKMMRDDPPDTMTNQIMAKLRSQPARKNGFPVWVGIAAVSACALIVVVGITFSGNANKNSEYDAVATDGKAAAPMLVADSEESARNSAPQAKSDERAVGGQAQGESKPKDLVSATPPAEPKPESNTASKEEIEEFTKPITSVDQESLKKTLPVIGLTSYSKDHWRTWADMSTQSRQYTSQISLAESDNDKKISSNQKTYSLTLTINRSNYPGWLKMAQKMTGRLEGAVGMPKGSDLFVVTIKFVQQK